MRLPQRIAPTPLIADAPLPEAPARRVAVPWKAVAVLALVGFGPGAVQQAGLLAKEWTLKRRVRQSEQARVALAQERDRLAGDAVYLEGLIRSTFKVAKPNELVVPIRPDELAQPARRQ